MNDPIFSQMKEQLIPSPAARAALEEGLSRPVRRPVHRCRYWVLAACLLLVPPCRWDTPSSFRPSTAM